MPVTVEIETVESFVEENGGSPLSLPSGDPENPDSSWQILPNGARFEKTDDAFLRREPPDDPVERLAEEARYLKIKCERLTRQSTELQSNLQLRAGFYTFSPNAILPDDGALQALAELMTSLRETESQFEAKNAEYLARRGPTAEDIRRQKQEERRVESVAFLNKMFRVAGRDVVAEAVAQDKADAEFLESLKGVTELIDQATDANVKQIKEQNRLRAMQRS